MMGNDRTNIRPPGFRREDETTEVFPLEDAAPAPKKRRSKGCITMVTGPEPGALFVLEDETILGRGAEAQTRIDDQGLSREHARITRHGDHYSLEDLDSTNGTFLNDRRVTFRTPLCDGDRIRIGKQVLLRFRLQDEEELEHAQQLYRSAVRDPLTDLFNRRYLDERLTAEFAYACRHQTPLVVLLLDVDHFKRVNDNFGHPVGDAVLRVVGATVGKVVRTEDLAARYGGEEFCVVARGIQKNQALVLAERLRITIERLTIRFDDQDLKVTASIGVATLVGSNYDRVEELLAAADAALYAAKREGRNRVISG